MSRGMWILAALIAAFTIALIYQQSSGNLRRPWAECKESLVQQMFSNTCTPVRGGTTVREPAASGEPPSTDPAERPVGEIKLK